MMIRNVWSARFSTWLVAGMLLAQSAFAEIYPKEIKFQHILQNRDIVVGEVRAIFQDSQGYMWLGGWNSLVRYNGYDVTPIFVTRIENGQEVLVPTTMTTAMFEDSEQNVWVGTAQGLLRFNPIKNELIPIKAQVGQTLDLSRVHVMGMREIATGEIAVASLDGAFIVNPETNTYQSLAFDPANPTSNKAPSSPTVPCVFLDSKSQVWFCTENGINRFDAEGRTFTRFIPDKTSNDRVANWVKDIGETAEGKFWLATELGVILWDPVTDDMKRYVYDRDDANSLGHNNIWDILVDSQERVWFASDGGGLNLYNPEHDNFLRYEPNGGKPSSLASDVVRTVAEDSSGDIWVGFYPEGVDFFDQSTTAIIAYTSNPANPNSISHSSVMSINEDKQGNLWLGTDGGGLSYFDRENDKFINYPSDPTNPDSPATAAILTTFLDSQDILWMGHWDGGVTRLDTRTKKFTRLPIDVPNNVFPKTSKALNSRHVWAIYEDSQNNLWFGTHTGGLTRYDRNTQTYHQYWHEENDPTSINGEWVWCIFEDTRKNLWIGTNSGLAIMDREKETFQRFVPDPNDPNSLSQPSVLAIFEDSKRRLWVGTNVGLNLFNYDTRNFTHVTTEDGLNNDNVRAIVEDNDGTLWLGTLNGVSSYNPDTGKIKNFNRDGGELVGGFNFGAGIFTKRGEVVMGGINGLRVYKPEELRDNPNIPPIVLTKLQIYSDIIGVDEPDGILKKELNFTDTIRLDYTKNMFEIDFAALNFRDPGKNQYAYKLEGFDEEWLYVGDKRSAKYTNLDAGTYTFRVKASNNDGVWNEEGKTVTIVQLPPWWETWWAYSIYVLTLLSIMTWIVQYQRRKRQRVEELNKILEMKVAERTAELRQKNQDIQSMLSNMRQGLFTIEKNGLIHPEYSQFLEQIFETTKVAGQYFMDFLFSRSHLGSNELDQIKVATEAIIGEGPMNFEFNSHLFFDEYDADIEGQRKHLSLDWNPIVVDEVVTKLMISVRDVTELKKIESEARTQKRELDIISQLLNMQTKKFNNFEKSVRKFIQENRNKITSSRDPSPDALALLFRNMHTIKGNSRTYGFTYLSDTAHEVESTYSEMKAANAKRWNADKLLEDLILVEKVMAEYADIFRRVLGRGDSGVRSGPGGIWLDDRAVQNVNSSIANIQLHLGIQDMSMEMQAVESSPESVATNTVDEVLSDIIDSLPSLASQLDKPNPTVKIKAGDVHFRENAGDLLNNIFSHILRNCIDHGIETPAEREAVGKAPVGLIELSVQTYGDHIDIHVKDDGRGLNIPKLRTIGVKMGNWSENNQPGVNEVAQLIFGSGVSTAENVTDISGRGVGMDAVKQYLLEGGGDVRVNLLEDEAGAQGFVPFEIIISLPATYYTKLKKAS